MKTYVMTTGTLFALLTLVHIWRVFEEPALAKDPWYWLITAVAGAMGVWAWRVVRTSRIA
jgi:hypothetical protein